MNRDAILIYLRDIRDLEVAKYYIAKLYDEAKDRIKELNNIKKIKPIPRPKLKSYPIMPKEPKKPHYSSVCDFNPFWLICTIISIIWGILGVIIWCTDDFNVFKYQLNAWIEDGNWFKFVFWIVFFILPGLLGIVYFIVPWFKYIQAKKDYDRNYKIYEKDYKIYEINYKEINQYNIESQKEYDIQLQESQSPEVIKKNDKKYNELKKQWNDYLDYLEKEENTVERILNNEYNLNLIPKDCRKLASIYYIYDYMSTSQESLTDTLLHTHMEDGICRIEKKLDFVISQNKELIFQNREIINNTKQIQENTKYMLYKLKQQLESQESMLEVQENILESQEYIEKNTKEAACYAKIAANYSEANAYFSLANYLMD